MNSILTSPNYESVIGAQQPDGFYRFERGFEAGMKNRIWCSDPFTVEHQMIDERLIFNVTFKTLHGTHSFEWDFASLKYQAAGGILIQTLFDHGVRICPDAKSIVTILTAIQKPDLFSTENNYDKH